MSDKLIENCEKLCPLLKKQIADNGILKHQSEIKSSFNQEVYRQIFVEKEMIDQSDFFSMAEKILNGISINKRSRKQLEEDPESFYKKASIYAISFYTDKAYIIDNIMKASTLNPKARYIVGRINDGHGFSDVTTKENHCNLWKFNYIDLSPLFSRFKLD